MRYFLMNKDTALLSFSTEDSFGSTEVVLLEVFTEDLPLGFVDIATWIENRNYAKHREHFKKWLHEWGIDTIDGFLNVSHALGLNDTLWVKPIDSSLSWNDVNLYENQFTDVACKTAFETGLYGLQLSSTSPEFVADGSFPKCWIKDEQGIHILKQGLSGASNVGLEPYCEYVSSNIGYELFPHIIKYDLTVYKGKLCSVCDLFTSQSTGYVPYSRLIDANKKYTVGSILQEFSEYDAKHNTSFELRFREMILLDCLIFNTDRHLGNFGFVFDNDTFRISDFAPVFDFNFSFLCSLTDTDLLNYRESMIKYDVGPKLGGTFEAVGSGIITPELRDRLPVSIDVPRHSELNMSKERLALLDDIFHENYDNIRNGRNIVNTAKSFS